MAARYVRSEELRLAFNVRSYVRLNLGRILRSFKVDSSVQSLKSEQQEVSTSVHQDKA